MAADKKTVTTQRTSKVLKAQLVLSTFLCWFGLLSWFLPYGGTVDGSEGVSWPATMMIAGAVWYVVTRIGIWWQHE